MQLDAPEIKGLKRSPLEICLEVLAATLMLAIWGIAIHQFRQTSQADQGIFVLPAVFMVIYLTFLGVWLLSPRYYNLWVPVTGANAPPVYGQARRLVCVLHLVIMVLFVLTTWAS